MQDFMIFVFFALVRSVYFIIGMLLLLSSCYEESYRSNIDVFELEVSPEMQEILFTSKDSGYLVEEPLALSLNGHNLGLRELKIRGETSLDYRRKSFAVKLSAPIYLKDPVSEEMKGIKKFKLISLCMDYCYINSRLSCGILRDAGVMPLFFKFVSLYMNGENQGVYFLMEDPETYYKEQNSEYILRRGYHHQITDEDYSPGTHQISQDYYRDRFHEIYSELSLYQNQELFDFLQNRINTDQLFRKIGVDYLLRNGDCTDELYFYAQVPEDSVRFNLIPWDYDDIFSSRPHEVGLSWSVGGSFGKRLYPTYQDVLDVTGDRLIYSIEDDLNYAIAIDSVLYLQYEKVLVELLADMDVAYIESLFQQLENELSPFYRNEETIQQSAYDKYPCTYELWRENMEDKKILVKQRLEMMQDRLKQKGR